MVLSVLMMAAFAFAIAFVIFMLLKTDSGLKEWVCCCQWEQITVMRQFEYTIIISS